MSRANQITGESGVVLIVCMIILLMLSLIGIISMTTSNTEMDMAGNEMHQTGALTIAQDEASCVVYGMPNEAVKRGGIDKILPLLDIPQAIMKFYESEGIHRSGKCA